MVFTPVLPAELFMRWMTTGGRMPQCRGNQTLIAQCSILTGTFIVLSVGPFCGAWALLFFMALSGSLVRDSRLLWVPPARLGKASLLGPCGLHHEERRLPQLLPRAASFRGLVVYGVFYFFLFGLLGH